MLTNSEMGILPANWPSRRSEENAEKWTEVNFDERKKTLYD